MKKYWMGVDFVVDDTIKITVLDEQENMVYLRFFNLEKFGDDFFEISDVDYGAWKMSEILYGVVEQDIAQGLEIGNEPIDINARQLDIYCYNRAADLVLK